MTEVDETGETDSTSGVLFRSSSSATSATVRFAVCDCVPVVERPPKRPVFETVSVFVPSRAI